MKCTVNFPCPIYDVTKFIEKLSCALREELITVHVQIFMHEIYWTFMNSWITIYHSNTDNIKWGTPCYIIQLIQCIINLFFILPSSYTVNVSCQLNDNILKIKSQKIFEPIDYVDTQIQPLVCWPHIKCRKSTQYTDDTYNLFWLEAY
jgi:hypothetical protein